MKKRICLFLLALALCLTACQTEPPAVSTNPTTEPPQTTAAPVETTVPPETTVPKETTLPPETEPQATFPMEGAGEQTGGVLRSIPVGASGRVQVRHLKWIDGNLLLVWGGHLQIWSAENGSVLHQKNISDIIQDGRSSLVVKDNIFAYYNEMNSAVVFRDSALNECRTVPIPKELSAGDVLISDDLTKAYHFKDEIIYVTDLETQETREVFRAGYRIPSISGLVMDSTVLVYWCMDSIYVSLETGQIIGKDHWTDTLYTTRDQYLIVRYEEGGKVRYIFQNPQGYTRTLVPMERKEYSTYSGSCALEANLVLNQFYVRNEDFDVSTFCIDLYDLSSGKRISEVSLGTPGVLSEGFGTVEHVLAVPGEPYVWIIGKNGDQNTLYRWAYQESAVEDETVYLQ